MRESLQHVVEEFVRKYDVVRLIKSVVGMKDLVKYKYLGAIVNGVRGNKILKGGGVGKIWGGRRLTYGSEMYVFQCSGRMKI